MQIIIEALGINRAGGGRSSILNLLQSIKSIDEINRYTILLSAKEPSLFSETGSVEQIIVPINNRFLSRIWAQIYIPLISHRYDLVHFTKNLGVYAVRCPFIVTIHDLTVLIYTNLFPATDVFYWKTVQKSTLKNSSRIIAVSKTTKNDITNYYQIDPHKIEVIYNPIGSNFVRSTDKEINKTKRKYGINHEYLLHVGRIDVKKNLSFLVRLFDDLTKKYTKKIELVIVGENYQKCQDTSLYQTIEELNLNEKVILTGKVPDEDLPDLYSGASVAVFPSHHEGFGLTQIEAMACGTPVVGHRAGAVGEVVDDAAVIIPDLNKDAFIEAIIELLDNQDFRHEMILKGFTRAKKFKGKNAAERTINLYNELSK